MDRRYGWLSVVGAVVFALAVGMFAYNAGVSHGLAAGATAGAVPPGGIPYAAYGWHRPWGFFPFAPFLFLFFWLFVFRAFFWRGYRGPWWYGGGPFDPQSRLDEWHRRAHEQMNGSSQPSPPTRV